MSPDFSNFDAIGERSPYDILKDMYDDENLEYMSDLSAEEIKAISVIKFLADYMKIPQYHNLIQYILKLKVSKDRGGREDFKVAFTGVHEERTILQKAEDKMLKGK